MGIDFSLINPELDAQPAFLDDVAQVRLRAPHLITYVNEVEQLGITRVEPLTHGTWNSVYLLQPNQLVLKLSPWSNNYEIEFLTHASKHQLATPKVVGSGKLQEPKLPEASYLLMGYIPNTANPSQLLKENALPTDKLNSIGQSVASILAQLHTETFDYIRSSDNRFGRWAPAINLGKLEPRGPFDARWIEKIETVLTKVGYRDFNRGHLIHSDANLNNVLIDKDDLSFKALIDPGPTIVGMPMFDLAYATWPWQYGLEYLTTVVERYRSLSPYFDEKFFYSSLLFIAYQQAEYGNFRAEHMPFFEEHIYSKINL